MSPRQIFGKPITITMSAIIAALACLLAQTLVAQPIKLDGAWANHESACSKLFVKHGGKISISKSADIYGSGFIVEANRIRGKIATCTITSRKEDGPIVHLMTTCSNDVALQNVQFSIKPEQDGSITRLFPGLPELNTTYYRCPF